MSFDISILVLSLAIILLSCELFTNAIEWLGKALKLGEGVVGSIFSAVGTCLPETMVPIIAIITAIGTTNQESIEKLDHIGIGAIVGAPFMLSTLAFFVSGISAVIFWNKRKTGSKMLVNNKILSRDIGFFLIVYTIGILMSFVDVYPIRVFVAILLVSLYGYYIYLTVSNDNVSHSELDDLRLARMLKKDNKLVYIIIQLLIALTGIVIGAKIFVGRVEHFSEVLGISALALSLVITPIATELPEKFNSIIWIRKKKDTLALGNITGAMVFQSCIPVALGIVATAWKPDPMVLFSAACAVASGIVTYLWIKLKKELSFQPLLIGGLFYAAFIIFLAMRGFH